MKKTIKIFGVTVYTRTITPVEESMHKREEENAIFSEKLRQALLQLIQCSDKID
jgi:hypothetical protein